MRNKIIGWVSLLVALLNWLSETPSQKSSNSTPAYLSFAMALLAVGTVRALSSSVQAKDPNCNSRHIFPCSCLHHRMYSWGLLGRKRLRQFLSREEIGTQPEGARLILKQRKYDPSFETPVSNVM